jgi:hypothetical protein
VVPGRFDSWGIRKFVFRHGSDVFQAGVKLCVGLYDATQMIRQNLNTLCGLHVFVLADSP